LLTRYGGARLRPQPRIAVVTNDALGNFVAATPLLQMLRAAHAPTALDYYGGTRVTELARASDLIDGGGPAHGISPREFVDALPVPYDLVVNLESSPWARCATALLAGESGYVCGPCIDDEGRADLPFQSDDRGDLWRDSDWLRGGLTHTYPFLDSGFIAEIICRLAYLEGPVPGYKLPREAVNVTFKTPDVLLSITASLAEKLWPIDRWVTLVQDLSARGVTAGLLGAKPIDQGRYWEGADAETKLIEAGAQDLRGLFSLPQVVSVIDTAKLVVSLDNGIVHLACSTTTPVIGLFRHGIHRLWAPPVPNLNVVEPGPGNPVSVIDGQTVAAHVATVLDES
jgi:ADP-heptose:LPS heptosyltransferase